jgi:hypothetical protein
MDEFIQIVVWSIVVVGNLHHTGASHHVTSLCHLITIHHHCAVTAQRYHSAALPQRQRSKGMHAQ